MSKYIKIKNPSHSYFNKVGRVIKDFKGVETYNLLLADGQKKKASYRLTEEVSPDSLEVEQYLKEYSEWLERTSQSHEKVPGSDLSGRFVQVTNKLHPCDGLVGMIVDTVVKKGCTWSYKIISYKSMTFYALANCVKLLDDTGVKASSYGESRRRHIRGLEESLKCQMLRGKVTPLVPKYSDLGKGSLVLVNNPRNDHHDQVGEVLSKDVNGETFMVTFLDGSTKYIQRSSLRMAEAPVLKEITIPAQSPVVEPEGVHYIVMKRWDGGYAPIQNTITLLTKKEAEVTVKRKTTTTASFGIFKLIGTSDVLEAIITPVK